jgi:hypothetical protein
MEISSTCRVKSSETDLVSRFRQMLDITSKKVFYVLPLLLTLIASTSARRQGAAENPVLFFTDSVLELWPPLWSSDQSSWLQTQRTGFDSRRYQIFWKVVGLKRGSLSLVSTTEEPLGRKSCGFGLENREYGSRGSAVLTTWSDYAVRVVSNEIRRWVRTQTSGTHVEEPRGGKISQAEQTKVVPSLAYFREV